MKAICMIAIASFLIAAVPVGAVDMYSELDQCLDRTNGLSGDPKFEARTKCYEKAENVLSSEMKKSLTEVKALCERKELGKDLCHKELDGFMKSAKISSDLTMPLVFVIGGTDPCIEANSEHEAIIAGLQMRIDALRHLARRAKANDRH